MSRKQYVLIFTILIVATVFLWWFYWRDDTPEIQLNYTIVANNLDVPWSLAIFAEDYIFFTERNGNVNLVTNDTVKIIHSINVKHTQNRESGLLGIALSPNFEDDQKIYLYYTYQEPDSSIWNRLTSFTFQNLTLIDETILLDRIPGGDLHNGGRIKFGPDGKLYVTTGEIRRGELSQDLESLAGKILRLHKDGTIPDDNPLTNSPIYSWGHRNPQGLAWHPMTTELYATEHGPSGEGLRFAHDEINLIEPGKNYGWPDVVGYSEIEDYEDPVFETGDQTWAPSGATFLDDPDSIWHSRLFIANLRGTSIRVLEFAPPDFRQVTVNEPIFQDLGRIRTVVQGPDGYLYFCTSNRDGRGSPRMNDDIIAKFKPP
jgi:aldose sugar dehydrogenase